ncbi:MAG: hypothetical protein IT436_00460 [Phycisphaerales bacterium]|nr:hypothetical protein [Phycisphaerales bacterium]
MFDLQALEARRMLAADPVTPDNPLWVVLPGEAVVDGVLNDAAWASAFTITRTQAFWSDSTATVKLLGGAQGLYLGFDVKDTALFADGKSAPGATIGTAFRWEVDLDDSMTIYFDPDGSRDEYFQASDRALGVGLGSQADFTTQSGALRVAPRTSALALAKYVKGDGAGNAPDVSAGGAMPTGLAWATVLHGTVNNANDLDEGWTTEIFIPWTAVGLAAAPTNGQTFGMNFDIIFDQAGGERDFVDHRSATDRFTAPTFMDDQITGVHSSYASTLAGIRGPVNYAQVVYLDPAAASKPVAITGMTAGATTGYSTRLNFTSPAGVKGTGATPNRGSVSAYEIRYATSTITTESDWLKATEFRNAYTPRLAGLSESLRLIGLTPGTTYFVAVRAVDGAGNLGDLSNIVTFTTQTTTQDPSGGVRVVPSPMGRTLVNEKGEPFAVVGDHLGLPWNYTRALYDGDVYDPNSGQYLNFYDNPSFEGPGEPYFDTLASYGVTTMRVYLELQNYNYRAIMPRATPEGLYWLEWRSGGTTLYNTLIRDFMHRVLEEAGKRGIHVIFSPFDSFSYDEAFLTEFAWSFTKGGPLDSIDNFFQNSQTLQLAKNRMQQLITWANASPYSQYLLGWEMLSEWDSTEWTLNAEGEPRVSANPADLNSGREDEYRRRSIWVDALAAYTRANDPQHLVLNSTIAQDPRGPEARVVYYSRNFDALTPHLYTNSNEEPINNPDTDTKVKPAVENATLTAYWLTHREDRAPIINGEWGMTRSDWQDAGKGLPHYSAEFTQAEDEAIFRTMAWSGLASGQAGMGLRISTEELSYALGGGLTQGYILTDGMRAIQKTFAGFLNSSTLALDFANYNFDTLAGRITTTNSSNKAMKAWGSTDGAQGLLYILQDGNRSTGSITGGKVTITGLRPDAVIDAEVWFTLGGVTAAQSVITGLFSPDGTVTFDLPTFTQDVAIKFKARAGNNQAQKIVSVADGDNLITFALDASQRPFARIEPVGSTTATIQNIAAIARFTARVVDMTPFVRDGLVHLAVTDENHHLWLFQGNTATAAWTVTDMTALIDAPGVTGDLTTYQPSWNAIHIAGLDGRGHAINYWFAPGQTTWQFSDLTDLFSGPLMTGGLTGYVTGWDGLNLAGLNSAGEVIVYWWAPGLANWETLNMTTLFSGPVLSGQLDAYVTPWGGLNIAGITSGGEVYTYWWAPGLGGEWQIANITDAASAPVVATGVEVAVSSDGGLNIFSMTANSQVHILRWTPAAPAWTHTNITTAAGLPAATLSMPLGSSAAGDKILLAGRANGATRTLLVYSFSIAGLDWDVADTNLAVRI